jgi:hypothetical protein
MPLERGLGEPPIGHEEQRQDGPRRRTSSADELQIEAAIDPGLLKEMSTTPCFSASDSNHGSSTRKKTATERRTRPASTGDALQTGIEPNSGIKPNSKPNTSGRPNLQLYRGGSLAHLSAGHSRRRAGRGLAAQDLVEVKESRRGRERREKRRPHAHSYIIHT